MAEGRPETSAQAEESRRRLARIALAALLVAAVLAGLRGEVRPLSFHRPPRVHALAVGLALEAVLAMLMIALVIRRRRAPQEALLAARLRGILGAALAAGLIGIPVGLLLTNLPKPRSRHQPANPFQHADLRRTTPPLRIGPGSHLPIGAILTTLLVLALVAAIVICVIVLRRRPRHMGETVLAPGDDDEENLRDAVESGRAALRELDDARAAIIACYLAMERSLAGAGAGRDIAETPDELLARAASAGLVRGEAAGRLTALFYEARFSSHPLPASSKAAAQRALSELAAGPGTPAGTAAAGTAAAGEAGTGEAAP
jgi:Domain of unknown function (DUF4129)